MSHTPFIPSNAGRIIRAGIISIIPLSSDVISDGRGIAIEEKNVIITMFMPIRIVDEK